jgi:hypothetical protein
MNVGELEQELASRGVDPRNYRIDEPPGESTMVLKKQGKVWLVYWSERGGRYDLQRFTDETSACEYMLGRLTVP